MLRCTEQNGVLARNAKDCIVCCAARNEMAFLREMQKGRVQEVALFGNFFSE